MKNILYVPAIICLTLVSCGNRDDGAKVEPSGSPVKNAVISYMSQPHFTNSEFTFQVTGVNVELQAYDMDENMLYFSAPKNDFDKTITLGKLTENPSQVEFGFEENGKSILGAYTLKGLHRYFFRFPKNNIKIDSARYVTKDFGKFKYSVSLTELSRFANNISVYGGRLDTNTGGNIYLANHGAFVSKGVEPSLKRLADQITRDESADEEISQKLLEFVLQNLRYSNFEAEGGYEILKRPNEVLMTGGSDCSGLTILYASLLEQYRIDYLLVYFKGHICAAVAGNFSGSNGLSLHYNGKKYTLAETTLKGFTIGATPLEQSFRASEITYIQKPGTDMVKYVP